MTTTERFAEARMIHAAKIGAAVTFVFLGSVPSFAQDCAGALDVKSSALTGTWTVVSGAAQTGGTAMFGGSNELVLQSSGGGVTLEVEGHRIALSRVDSATPAWTWAASDDVMVDSEEFEVTLGCDNDALARFEGQQKVAGQFVTWRLMVQGPEDAFVFWSFPGPPASAGLFGLSR